MKLSELIAAYGDDEVKFQNLDNSLVNLEYSAKKGTKITFGTDEATTMDGTKKLGLIVWLDRDKVKQIVGSPK